MSDQLDLLSYRPLLPNLHFYGSTFDAALDIERLGEQQRRVLAAMEDGAWRTLREIAAITQDPEASVSARLRSFNGHDYLKQFFIMESERMPGMDRRGVWRYRLLVREE